MKKAERCSCGRKARFVILYMGKRLAVCNDCYHKFMKTQKGAK